jgi:hypothetical protein
MHSDGFHIIDSVIAADTAVVNCNSSSFFVVPDGAVGRKLRKIFVASFVKAAGSVEVQVMLLRSGATSNLLSSTFTYDTSTFFGNTIDVLNTSFVAGDVLFNKVLNVTGAAKGLSITLDIR